MSTEQRKEAAHEHLRYEFEMLTKSAIELCEDKFANQYEANKCIEVFLTHTRLMIEFFSETPDRETDLTAAELGGQSLFKNLNFEPVHPDYNFYDKIIKIGDGDKTRQRPCVKYADTADSHGSINLLRHHVGTWKHVHDACSRQVSHLTLLRFQGKGEGSDKDWTQIAVPIARFFVNAAVSQFGSNTGFKWLPLMATRFFDECDDLAPSNIKIDSNAGNYKAEFPTLGSSEPQVAPEPDFQPKYGGATGTIQTAILASSHQSISNVVKTEQPQTSARANRNRANASVNKNGTTYQKKPQKKWSRAN